MRQSRPLLYFKWAMYLLATLQFIRVYIYGTTPYLNLPAYLGGRERLPFQERILPVFFLDLFYKSRWIMNHMNHTSGAFAKESGPSFFLALVSLAACCFFLLKLYHAVSRTHSLSVLVYPFFLFTVMLTYSGHLEQNYSYPYDFPALAFFTAGLYFIYTRRFVPLVVVVFFGTLNRETTLFLLGIYALDAASVEGFEPLGLTDSMGLPDSTWRFPPLWKRLSPARIPWLRLALLLAIWISIKLTLAHLFRDNDRSEDYPRFFENLERIRPHAIPAMLNLCGYLLPIVFVLRNSIRPSRFGNYVYILPLWLAVMFYTGVITEVRIYGELCSYAAVACVLLLEEQVAAWRPAQVAGQVAGQTAGQTAGPTAGQIVS